MMKKKPKSVMTTKPMTVTQPEAWVEAWKEHMKVSGRVNLSAFIAEAVNGLIASECKKYGRPSPVAGTRGEKGRKPVDAG
jgi:hypothetical protein